MNKEAIKKNFSKYARHYDKYSTIQDLCASRLITRIKSDDFRMILDIGCGTGNYTSLLRSRFPAAKIKAVDISGEMIDVAREKIKDKDTNFIIADGERIDLREQFDLVSSNATFQWFESLDTTLSKYKKLLSKNGIISFSAFGPLTFHELNWTLRELFGRDISISSCNFIDAEDIVRISKPLFKNVRIEEKIYKEKYGSLSELLKKIKYTGTRGNGIKTKRLWTAKVVKDLERIYKKRFGDITATYQIFFCTGVK